MLRQGSLPDWPIPGPREPALRGRSDASGSPYREAVALGEVETNPTRGLRLPASRGRRERIATPEEAELLVASLGPQDPAKHVAMRGLASLQNR